MNTSKLCKAWLILALGGLLLTSTPTASLAAATAVGVENAPAAALQQQTPEPVYALQGTLGKAVNQNFATFLTTPDGTAYALVGETPDVEQQLTTLRDQAPNTLAKVWGALYPQGRVSATPEIVVSSILPAEPIPTPTPAPQQPVQPLASVTSASINVRSGPSTAYPIVGALQLGQQCPIIGRDAATTWWQVQCANGVLGWVFDQLVTATGAADGVPVINTPPPPPPPPPPPAPTIFYGWKASVWHNRDLAGDPAKVADVREIAFAWGDGPPDWPDNFSTRFERTINFTPGTYRFFASADDGVRVFIDNQLIINEWHQATGNVQYTADRSMYGNQAVRVEQYEAAGQASVHFSYAQLGNSTIDGGGSGEWSVNYFNNPDLSGNPALVRREPRSPHPLDQNWGNGSPAPGVVNDDNWSARWRGQFYFESGNWEFRTNTDDGVRVYIDGIRIIDGWNDGYKEPQNKFNNLGAGNHEITIEYYERGGGAMNRVWWWRNGGSGGIRPDRDQ